MKNYNVLVVDPSGFIKNGIGHIGCVYFKGKKENGLTSEIIQNFTLEILDKNFNIDYDKLFENNPEILVVEDYINYPEKQKYFAYSKNTISELIGELQNEAKRRNITIVMQRAVEVKKMYNNTLLLNFYKLFYKEKKQLYLNTDKWHYDDSKDLLHKINSRHEMDAFRHLLFYLNKTGGFDK